MRLAIGLVQLEETYAMYDQGGVGSQQYLAYIGAEIGNRK